MKKLMLLFLILIFSFSLITSSELGFDNSHLPKLEAPAIGAVGLNGSIYYNITGDASNWSSYPALTNVNMNFKNINNVNTLSMGGIFSSSIINFTQPVSALAYSIHSVDEIAISSDTNTYIFGTGYSPSYYFSSTGANFLTKNLIGVRALVANSANITTHIIANGNITATGKICDSVGCIGAGGNSSFNQSLTDTLYSPVSEPIWTANSTLVGYLDKSQIWTQDNNFTKNFYIGRANSTDRYGVIYKLGENLPFIHDFSYGRNAGGYLIEGKNLFVGEDSGNFNMGSTATATYKSSLNAGFGYASLKSLTDGYNNVGFAAYSLTSLTTGFDNMGIGAKSLGGLTTGNYNIGIGYQAGRYYGVSSLVTTVDKSIFIGTNTKPLADNDQYEVVIGDSAVGKGSNTITIGDVTNTKETYLYGNINLTNNITFSNGGKIGAFNTTCMAIWSPVGTAHTFCD